MWNSPKEFFSKSLKTPQPRVVAHDYRPDKSLKTPQLRVVAHAYRPDKLELTQEDWPGLHSEF